jgi:SpoVK/Ycf46/Vps4 family AAA+-type ATPase
MIAHTEDLSLAYFLNLLQGTITPDGLVFIATTNHLDKLDPAFYRDGRFDIKIHMTEADDYQLNKIYTNFMNRPLPEKYIPALVEKGITPATFIFTIKDYICDDFSDEEILHSLL